MSRLPRGSRQILEPFERTAESSPSKVAGLVDVDLATGRLVAFFNMFSSW